MLSPLQERLLALVWSLPEAGDFALAGGAALIVHGAADRETRDLDLFAAVDGAVDRLLGPLTSAITDADMSVIVRTSSPTFARLEVSDDHGATELDLAIDARIRPVDRTPAGRLLALDELAADKTVAVFGRALPATSSISSGSSSASGCDGSWSR